MKVVINKCFGGFGISHKAAMRYFEIKGIKVWPEKNEKYLSLNFYTYWTKPPKERPTGEDNFRTWPVEKRAEYNKAYKEATACVWDIGRNDPALVQTVEELGAEANGEHARLVVVNIPDGVEWEIDEYDGMETVQEARERWG